MSRERNAKDELLEILDECDLSITDVIAFKFLKCNKTTFKNELIAKGISLSDELDKLDFCYNAGYGSQELWGIVLFRNNTWLSRGEYDGSEWWEYNVAPTIDEILE